MTALDHYERRQAFTPTPKVFFRLAHTLFPDSGLQRLPCRRAVPHSAELEPEPELELATAAWRALHSTELVPVLSVTPRETGCPMDMCPSGLALQKHRLMRTTPDDVEKSASYPDCPSPTLIARIGGKRAGTRRPARTATTKWLRPWPRPNPNASHLQGHEPARMTKAVGVETVNHSSDVQLVAQARTHHILKDRMIRSDLLLF